MFHQTVITPVVCVVGSFSLKSELYPPYMKHVNLTDESLCSYEFTIFPTIMCVCVCVDVELIFNVTISWHQTIKVSFC